MSLHAPRPAVARHAPSGMFTLNDWLSSGPHVIGATGGSGTRVVARIVRRGGMFIGTTLNRAEDAIAFGAYSDRWINEFMRDRWLAPPAPTTEAAMVRDLHDLLEAHLSPLTPAGARWGWKEPRSIYLLPFWHRQLPALKFLHVVRDGRDMAYSGNQNQLVRHGDAVFEDGSAAWGQPRRSIALWSRINLLAADYGETRLRAHYLRVRFEDLCATPVPVISRIFEFFGLRGDIARIAEAEVRPPESLGRWRARDAATLAELHRLGGAALARFGYGPAQPDASVR